jgi:acetyl esterase/lipase
MCRKNPLLYQNVQSVRVQTNIFLLFHNLTTVAVIDIHGGGFMLGHSSMVNKDQIQDCLDRGWIVVVPDHRLCPQIEISDIIDDIRDLLKWIQDGSLDQILAKESKSSVRCDVDRVVAFGTSAGGHLSLCLVGPPSIPTAKSVNR